jgi:hypothetical protein
VVVMISVAGRPPETEADWRRVADTLRQLHRLTPLWPQRPGWRSSTDLCRGRERTFLNLNLAKPYIIPLVYSSQRQRNKKGANHFLDDRHPSSTNGNLSLGSFSAVCAI